MDTLTNKPSLSILIPDGETWDTVKVLRCLKQAPQVKVIILSRDRWSVARFSRRCVGYYHHTSQSDEDWIRLIRSMVQELQINVVMPITERGVEFVTRNKTAISEFTTIPSLPDFEVLMMVQDKWRFHCFAKQQEFPVPASVMVGRAGEPVVDSLDLDSIEYPALLKPTLLDGGFGIVAVKDPSDFHKAWEDKRIIQGCRYLLQSYVPGVDLCLHLFCKGGRVLAHTLQRSLYSPIDFFGPQKAMEFVDDQMTIELGTRLVSAMQWDGIACIDFRLDTRDQTQKILEVNPRFGQAILGCLVAGVNFPLLVLLDAVNERCLNMRQHAVRYAHPITHLNMLISRFFRRQPQVCIQWREGGLQFTVHDPLPELVDFTRRAVKRFRHDK